MRSEKKQEARSVNPVQAQIKSLSGAILTIIDATYHDPTQREAVKSLIRTQIRAKMDLLTLEWIATNALKLTEPIRTQPFDEIIEATGVLTSTDPVKVLHGGSKVWVDEPYSEQFTEEERQRLAELDEEVVEVDGIEFAKETFKEKVVVDGVEFEKDKNPDPSPESDSTPAHMLRGRASNDVGTCAVFTNRPFVPGKTDPAVEVVGLENDNNPMTTTFALNKRHVARANEVAEAEPDPFIKALCKKCEDPSLKAAHTCKERIPLRLSTSQAQVIGTGEIATTMHHAARANQVAETEFNPFSKVPCKQCKNPNLKGIHTCEKEKILDADCSNEEAKADEILNRQNPFLLASLEDVINEEDDRLQD